MTNELVDLLPWLDGYVVGQSYTHSSSFDFSEAVSRLPYRASEESGHADSGYRRRARMAV